MKTNKFEEILRRKLESLQPDFQDQDWDKWQSFNKLHAPPSFWQSYGQWLGYAVATVTTAVMVVLYVSQSNQNEALRKEMEGLKQQMEVRAGSGINSLPDSAGKDDAPVPTKASPPAPDTVYIIERQTVYREILRQETPDYRPDNPAQASGEEASTPEKREALATDTGTPPALSAEGTLPASQPGLPVNSPLEKPAISDSKAIQNSKPNPAIAVPNNRLAGQTPTQETGSQEYPKESADQAVNGPKAVPTANRTGAALPQAESVERIVQSDLEALSPQEFSNSRNYLYRRLQARMPRKTPTLTPTPVVPIERRAPEKLAKKESHNKRAKQPDEIAASPPADQKVEEIKKEESLLPKFGLGLPYRVGVSQQWQGNTRAFSVMSEFIVSKHWAVQAGLSWRRLETQKFFNEKIYLAKTREDIRKQHARKLPPSFEIFNIETETTLLQIPLGLTYRGEMGNGFTYLVGTSTNLNIEAKQRLTIDFRLPSRDYGQQSAERYPKLPTLNNMALSAGIEKRWSPIVLQVGSFVESRGKTFPFLKDRTNVGFQVKILYELGGRKNN